MRAKLPIIKTASESGPTRFNIGVNLRPAEREKLIKLMRKRGNSEWQPSVDEIVIESSRESAKLMQEPPVGRQAIIGGR